MSFFFFKPKPSLTFVFDIRDASVSLAAVRFSKENKPDILVCKTFGLRYHDSKNHKKYLSSMARTMDKAVISVRRSLLKMGNRESIKDYHFFIGSPWSVSKSKTIKVQKEKPFEINNSVLNKIIVGEEENIEKSLEEQTQEADWKVLEEKIIESKLNGYRVDDIYGKKTSNLAIELFVSFVPFELKQKILSYLDERVGRNINIQNNSCILSSYSFFRDIYTNKNNFIYVDIGKLITDIYVVREDIIFGVASMPFGEESIIEESVSRGNLSKEIFISHINIGHDKKFDVPSHNNGEDLLKFGFELWERKFKETMSKVCTEMNVPSSMFVIANSTLSTILTSKLISSDKNNQFEILGSKIEVSLVPESIMNSLIQNGKTFINEPYIKMDTVFIDKIFAKK